MARLTATNFSGALQFPYATAATDLFKKEDVQTLALAVDQHDHSGGKGLGVSGGSIKTAIDMPDWFRSTGHTSPFPGTGAGLELYYDPAGSAGTIQAYNRGGALYAGLGLGGSTISINAANSGANTTLAGYMDFKFINGAMAITSYPTHWISGNPGLRFPSGATMTDLLSGPDAYVQVSQMTVTPGKLAAGVTNINGALTVVGSTVHQGTVTCQSTFTCTATAGMTNINMAAGAQL